MTEPTPAEIEALAARLEKCAPHQEVPIFSADLRLAARIARAWVIALGVLNSEAKPENWLRETFDSGTVDNAWCRVCGAEQKYDRPVEHEDGCRIKAVITALAAVEGAEAEPAPTPPPASPPTD